MRVLAVNNYPSDERFIRLYDALRANGARTYKARWFDSSARVFNSFDGIVLSGSPDMLSEERVRKKFAPEIDAIGGTKVPLLGVCFGHQLLGLAFGSNVVTGRHVLKFVETELLREDPIFAGMPPKSLLLESHHEEVDKLPDGFSLLAKSRTSAIAAMKHPTLELYGLQFHPERSSKAKPDGNTLISNFVKGIA